MHHLTKIVGLGGTTATQSCLARAAPRQQATSFNGCSMLAQGLVAVLRVCSAEIEGLKARASRFARQQSPREVHFMKIQRLGDITTQLGECPQWHGHRLWMLHCRALARFDPAGQLTHRIELPVVHPSALCFGGSGLADVFVTSISDSGRLNSQGPLDGGVLKLTGLGFRCLAPHTCRIPLRW
jgi:hypothetical protein